MVNDGRVSLIHNNKVIEPYNIYWTFGYWYMVWDTADGRRVAALFNSMHHGIVCYLDITKDGSYDLTPYPDGMPPGWAEKHISLTDNVSMFVAYVSAKQRAPVTLVVQPDCKLTQPFRELGEHVSDGTWTDITRPIPPKGLKRYITSDDATHIVFVSRRPDGRIAHLTFWLHSSCTMSGLTSSLNKLGLGAR